MSIRVQKHLNLLPFDQLFDREKPFMSLLEAQLFIVKAIEHYATELGVAQYVLDLFHIVFSAVVVVRVYDVHPYWEKEFRGVRPVFEYGVQVTQGLEGGLYLLLSTCLA